MGQTLTHGVYLPDEGERNCYAGLAANWQLLDGAVGTIAEHTTALSGKAPLVHTHTKADITDFPAYGNAAGTICEGNDSRLSDARTPVAHTHSKSDITDLFNSVNVWTETQTYTGMMILNSSSDVVEQFRQKLPKDVSTSSDALVRFNTLVDSAGHNVVVNSEGHWDTYVAKTISLKYKNDSTKQGSIEFRLCSDGTGLLYPQSPFECDLGNSYNKWKSLNRINPGALSLPNYADVVALDTTNWSKAGNMIVYTPTFDGWLQITIPNDDDVQGNKSNMISILDSGTSPIAGFTVSNILGPRLYFLYPVRASRVYWLYIKSYSEIITTARLVKCMGNV